MCEGGGRRKRGCVKGGGEFRGRGREIFLQLKKISKSTKIYNSFSTIKLTIMLDYFRSSNNKKVSLNNYRESKKHEVWRFLDFIYYVSLLR